MAPYLFGKCQVKLFSLSGYSVRYNLSGYNFICLMSNNLKMSNNALWICQFIEFGIICQLLNLA